MSRVDPVGALPPGQTRDALLVEVRERLTAVPRDAVVLAACSGGPDSTALAYLVAEARDDLTLVLGHVAHGLRAGDADQADRGVVAIHGAWLGAEVVGRDVEVVVDGRGVEAAARQARYAALREVAAERGATAILVGHSADDQAETVLLRLARGTGTDGLAAMAVVSGDLVRPLLRIRRADLRAFVVGDGLPTAVDATNTDPAIRRVRVREEVLPALARVAPDPVGSLVRLADLVRADAALLDAAAATLPDAIRRVGSVVALRAELLEQAPPALVRRVVRHAVAGVAAQPPSAATVARILETPVGSGATLPGGLALRVERSWRTLDPVTSPGSASDVLPAAHRAAPLAVTRDAAVWAPAGLTLVAITPGDDPAGAQLPIPLPGLWTPPPHRVDAVAAAPGTHAERYGVLLPELDGLTARHIAPGDRIVGSGGRRRVVEVLRDAGVPRAVRRRWPVVTGAFDGTERVVWIPGVAVDAELAAAGRACAAIALRATPTVGRRVASSAWLGSPASRPRRPHETLDR